MLTSAASRAEGRYESIAAGCIPIIVADKLRLPFSQQISWPSFSLRYSEREVASDPRRILRDVQVLTPTLTPTLTLALTLALTLTLTQPHSARRGATPSSRS